MRNLGLFIVAFFMVFLFSCGGGSSSSTSKTIEYGDALRDAINKFEDKRKEFSKEISDVVENTDEELNKENPNIEKVAEDWDTKWNSIIDRFQEIEKDFTAVGESSAIYFQKLEEIALSINDEQIKQSEIKKNKELKERWTKTYTEAAESINKVRNILKDGSDFQKVLIASSVRQKIEENIEELKSISDRAKQILTELENFTEEGKKLVNG